MLLILLLGGALMATTFLGARRAVETLSRTLIGRAADQAELELRRFFEPVMSVLGAVREWDEAGQLPADVDGMRAWLLPAAERLPQVAGILLARGDGSERFLTRSGGGWRSRRTAAGDSGLETAWLGVGTNPTGTADYDPRVRPWYRGALAAAPRSIFWTEPYLFFTRKIHGMTAAAAYTGSDGGERVAALDVSLADLADFARSIEVSAGGGLWIVTEDRRLLSWPEDPRIWGDRDSAAAMLKRPEDLDLDLVDDALAVLRNRSEALGIPVAERLVEVDEGRAAAIAEPIRFASGGAAWWVAGRLFRLSSERALMIVVTVPQADLLGDRARLRWWILAITLIVLAGAVLRAGFLARRFSEPIEALVAQSDRIRRGDFEPGEPIEAPVTEVQQLADSQERMRRGLKTLMKIEGDLQVARQIQQKTFPRELPTLAGFDIAAYSQPADETGGDSFDVIGLTGDGALTEGEAESLVLMLADATGHGIGPALSVTQLRAMLRMAVRNGSSLAETAAHINEQLFADLPQNRFITAWLGRLDRDGTLRTFSGGQAPLFLYRAESGEVEVLNASAPPLGLLPPMPVVLPPATRLEPGDVYVVLSDGFYEAENPDGTEFEKEGVIGALKECAGGTASGILEALRAAVLEFTHGAPLADDRTAVIIKRTA